MSLLLELSASSETFHLCCHCRIGVRAGISVSSVDGLARVGIRRWISRHNPAATVMVKNTWIRDMDHVAICWCELTGPFLSCQCLSTHEYKRRMNILSTHEYKRRRNILSTHEYKRGRNILSTHEYKRCMKEYKRGRNILSTHEYKRYMNEYKRGRNILSTHEYKRYMN